MAINKGLSELPEDIQVAIIEAAGRAAAGAVATYPGNGNGKLLEALELAVNTLLAGAKP